MEGDLSSQMLHLASGRHFDCSKYDVKGPGIQANVTLKQSLDREVSPPSKMLVSAIGL